MNEFINSSQDFLRPLLGMGLDPKQLSLAQVTLRGLIIFVAAIVIVRLADKRFLARKTAFDAVLAFVLASMLARAINGSAPFLPSIACGFALAFAHRLIAFLSCRWHWFGVLVKGRDDLLIQDGELRAQTMRRHSLSEGDVAEALRLCGVANPRDVKEARFERNGELSVIHKVKRSE